MMKHDHLNPVVVEVIRHALQAITDEVELDITLTAYSPLVYEYKDFAVGLVDAEGLLIAQCRGGIPIFLASVLSEAVRDGLEIYGLDNIHAGDVILTNFPGTTGQHLNHMVTYTPIFGRNSKEIVAFSVILVHCADIGGRYVGSIGSETTDIFQEGTALRTVKLEQAGKRVEEIYRIIAHNTRFPEMVFGDLASQIAGTKKGAAMFDALLEKYGDEVLLDAIATVWDQTDAEVRRSLRSIPEGEYRASSFLDNDGVVLDKPIRVDITVRVGDGKFVVDFTNVEPELRGPFNSGRHGGGMTAARIAFRYLTTPGDMTNDGSFRALEVVLPEGRFLSASNRAAKSGYSIPLPTVIDTIIKAVAEAIPERAAAGHHANFGTHLFLGHNPKTGRLFSHVDTALAGWGASIHGDGGGPYKTLAHADTRDIPIEAVEALYPLRVNFIRMRQDSGGPGRHRGGLGIEKQYEFLAPCEVNIWIERSQCPPWGIAGGRDGLSSFAMIEGVTRGEGQKVFKASNLPLQAGERLTIHSGGGGGWGPPSERSVEAVKNDVEQGYLTPAAAKREYEFDPES